MWFKPKVKRWPSTFVDDDMNRIGKLYYFLLILKVINREAFERGHTTSAYRHNVDFDNL